MNCAHRYSNLLFLMHKLLIWLEHCCKETVISTPWSFRFDEIPDNLTIRLKWETNTLKSKLQEAYVNCKQLYIA